MNAKYAREMQTRFIAHKRITPVSAPGATCPGRHLSRTAEVQRQEGGRAWGRFRLLCTELPSLWRVPTLSPARAAALSQRDAPVSQMLKDIRQQ